MNIKEAEIATIDTNIADKTDIYSVTTADVADRFKEIVALLGAILVNPDLTYNIGLIVYTASPFSVYVCKVDGATGDVANQTNWLKIAGSGLPYLVAGVDVYDTTVPFQSEDYYVPVAINMSVSAGKLFCLLLNGVQPATNSKQIGYAITLTTTGSIDGSSILIQTDCNGVGMSTLQIDTIYNERLEAGATYLITKTYDSDLSTGYNISKIGSGGIKEMIAGQVLFKVSTGKTLINGATNANITLPSASGLGGEECIIIRSETCSSLSAVNASAGDSIINVDSLLYNRPYMRFTSDGIDKWYYS